MSINNTELMNKAKELLKEEVTTISYDTWLKTLDILDIDNTQITLSTRKFFSKRIFRWQIS